MPFEETQPPPHPPHLTSAKSALDLSPRPPLTTAICATTTPVPATIPPIFPLIPPATAQPPPTLAAALVQARPLHPTLHAHALNLPSRALNPPLAMSSMRILMPFGVIFVVRQTASIHSTFPFDGRFLVTLILIQGANPPVHGPNLACLNVHFVLDTNPKGITVPILYQIFTIYNNNNKRNSNHNSNFNNTSP
jgi:hypothetical protein